MMRGAAMKRNRITRFELPPATALILYYLVSIGVGTFLLSLPWASTADPLGWLDALFTATSAQCVTGLVVVDTGSRFTLFGQGVILLLIQTGGLGITTFSVYLFFYLRQRVGLRGRWFVQATLLHSPVESLPDLIRTIFRLTLIIEGLGTALLAVVFVPEQGWGAGLWSALFHSISAFCNAGFSLYSDSLIRYASHPLVNVTIMVLIVLGGLGFLVLSELIVLARQRQGRRRLSLHSRLVLVTTVVLIVGGTLVMALLESGTLLQQLPAGESFWVLLFQSVTARTAGFNTIDLNRLGVPTLFFMMFLMFVGGSPGSAAGGIKTTSLALFAAILYGRLRGFGHTNIWRRTIPDETATRTLTLVMLAMLVVMVALLALLGVELQGQATASSGQAFINYAFEAMSAFGTVGLSLGVTSSLSVGGKLIIIGLMFLGRVGILTVAFAFLQRAESHPARYSEENIMIG